ncbi:MAG: amino acid adenylation domain-containing protein [Ruminococcaceae bacterium]|nr:amino acid adenylation domain-containing protein [Oscillospiraceae bacterium]
MKNILEYFEKTVKTHPNKVGFVDECREATFSQTALHARAIATALCAWGNKRAVAILIDKTVNCIDTMLGALYAGDFYVVIDVHSPVERVNGILNILDNPVILTDKNSEALAGEIGREYLLYEELIQTEIDEAKLLEKRNCMCDLDTAYILFTSGSTGMPKGTVISHRALISYINWVTEEFGFNAQTVFGSQTPLYFSMSVTDFYSTIKCGCTYHIIPKPHFTFPLNLVGYLNDNKINTIYWVPTAISILSNWKVFDVIKPQYLKTVLFAGEVMPTKQLNYWIDHLDSTVTYANLFGPTETTDICAFYILNREFSDSDTIPIGKACDNCDCFVVNSEGKAVTAGEEGELYVRSGFMANGYYRNPEKTAEAFVQNPLQQDYPETVYKTGDIVKYNDKGELVYITRRDFQIKRSGYRIELGEIEAGANSVEKVKSCACIYDSEADLLVLIYEGAVKDTMVVLEAVRNHVPAYMVPDEVRRIKEMPINANGKLDRKALLATYKTL